MKNKNDSDKNFNKNTATKQRPIENVLVLQGGGSLGAFAFAVFKTLDKKNY